MKILIVEDEVLYCNALESHCRSHSGNHEIKIAETLAQSDLIRQNFIPDLVISDMDLPDGNGVSRFERIKKQNPKVMICLITGNIQEPENHGAHFFFSKNIFNSAMLMKLLTTVEGVLK